MSNMFKMCLLCALSADYSERVSTLKKELSVLTALLEKKEVELEDCREESHLKTVEIEEMKKTLDGM